MHAYTELRMRVTTEKQKHVLATFGDWIKIHVMLMFFSFFLSVRHAKQINKNIHRNCVWIHSVVCFYSVSCFSRQCSTVNKQLHFLSFTKKLFFFFFSLRSSCIFVCVAITFQQNSKLFDIFLSFFLLLFHLCWILCVFFFLLYMPEIKIERI